MRLGQISRKLNLRPIQIRDFIRDKFKVEIETDLNTKLEDNYITALQQKFETAPELELFKAQKEDQKEEVKPEPEDRWAKKAAELIQSKKEAEAKTSQEPLPVQDFDFERNIVEPVSDESVVPVASEHVEPEIYSCEDPEEKTEAITVKQEDIIDPFTPRRVDPDAELIKATQVKLEGPKVIGKIALPPTKKELAAAEAAAAQLAKEQALLAGETVEGETPIVLEGEIIAEPVVVEEASKVQADKQKSDPISKKMAAMKASDPDEEYSPFKDSKGIYHFSKEQKNNRKKSLERLKSGKKEESQKRSKSNYYQQNFKPETKEVVAKKKEKKETVSKKTKEAPKPAPKGLWGKFRNWLNG